MSRPPALVPNEHLHIRIEPSLKQKLDLLLFSELESRIPKGAHKDFIESRLREYFTWHNEPLERFGFPAGYFVSGPKEMVQALVKRLEKDSRRVSEAEDAYSCLRWPDTTGS